jgi:hypothetical protein
MVKTWIYKFGSSLSHIINYVCWDTSSFFPAPMTILAAQLSKEEGGPVPIFLHRLFTLILQMFWVTRNDNKIQHH